MWHYFIILQRHYSQLREEFAKMKAPADLEDDDDEDSTSSSPMHSAGGALGTTSGSGVPPNGLNTPLSNSSSSTGTFSDCVTSSSTESGLSQQDGMHPNAMSKYKDAHEQHVGGVSDNKNSNNHVDMNHVGGSQSTSGSHHMVPISNGDVSEEMAASMFLGPEDEHVGGPPNLQATDNIMFL